MGGELLSVHGVLHGGAGKEEATSTLRRETELRELRVEVERLDVSVIEKEEHLETLRMQHEEQQRDEANARDAAQKNRESISQLQGKVSVVQRALQQATAKLDSLDWEQNQIAERLAEAEAKIQRHREDSADRLPSARSHPVPRERTGKADRERDPPRGREHGAPQ